MNHDDAMSPAERERLAQELLELHFGCHENPGPLQARLAREPALRALQAEVLRQAQTMERAVRQDQPPLALRAPAPPSPWRWAQSAALRLLAAAAAAALVVGGLFVAEHLAQDRLQAFKRERLHVTVSGPRAIPAGVAGTFTVQAQDLTGAGVDADLRWEAIGGDGAALAAGAAPLRGGTATISMPADPRLRVPARIVVTAQRGDQMVRHEFALSAAAAAPLVHVATDRPVYRPGEPVFVRAVVLDRLTRLPLPRTTPLVARLVDANGSRLAVDHDAGSEGGVGSFVLAVPAASAGGPHRIEVGSPQDEFPAESVDIVVRPFQPPQLQKTIVLDRASYAPGARGAATVTALRLAAGGGGASGASARGALVLDGEEVWHERRVLGADGTATFAFTIPKDVDKGAARFVATIDDGGIVETEVKPFVVPTGKVSVAAFPEGGDLVAGVENAVYLACTDALDRPIDGAGELLDGRGRQVAKFRTQHQGRAKVGFVPRTGEAYRVRLAGHEATFPLPEVRPDGIALRLLGDDVGPAAPLRLALAGRGNGPWLVGVFCRGALVGQTTLRADDGGELRSEASIDLAPEAAGVLRVTVFDRALQPVAERLVRRLPRHHLAVELTAQHADLSPGDAQQLRIRTRDERGNGCRALVGIAVSDQAIHALGSEPLVGLVDHALLFADVERVEDLGDYFLGGAGAAACVDLLLGTRGWRRFVWRNDANAQAAIAARGPAAAGTLAREGFSPTPQVLSNLEAARTGIDDLQARVWQAEQRLRAGIAIALALLLLLAIGEGIAGLLRRAGARPFVQVAAAAAVACALLAVLIPPTLGARRAADGVQAEIDFVFDGSDGIVPRLQDATAAAPERTAANDFFLARSVRQTWQESPIDDASRAADAEIAPPAREQQLPFEPGAGGSDGNELPNLRRTRLSRQYAHQHRPATDRRDFTPTILWQTLVSTDEDGHAAVTFATSDAVTTWRVHADAHAPAGTGRLGQATIAFATRLPLHVDARLPDEVAAGDRLLLPIGVVCSDPALTEVELSVFASDGLRRGDDVPERIALQGGRGRILLPVDVADLPGTGLLRLEARAGRFVDRITQRIAIAPRGFPHRRSVAGSAAPGQPGTGTLVIPADPVAGSLRVTLQVYPSPLSALTEGLAGILREPHGCFEQASSSNYPNTLVLNLLEASGDDVPMVAARARALLPAGYAKITSYECRQRGYEWFGADPGHEALTAYGLLQFHDMAKVHDVDAAMVARTKDWLLARRDGKGNFAHAAANRHSFGGRSQPVTNAYVAYALLQAGTPAGELRAELDALLARAAVDDPYELALIACALQLAGRNEAAAVRQRLVALQRPDGSLRGTTTITCSGGEDLVVETTGFAVLAWLPDPALAANVRGAVEALQRRRAADGTFGATQATIVALRALVAYATATRIKRADGTLRVFADDRLLAERAFSAADAGALTFEFADRLAAGEHALRLEVEGGGAPLPWACDVAYHAELPADDPEGAVAIATALRAGAAREGETIALDVAVTNRTDRELPTPIAVIGLPAGCELPTRVLDDLLRGGAFASWELRGRELVLYWRQLDARAEQRLTIDLVARVPGATTGPASRAWLYYTPGQRRWAAPVRVSIAGA
jgi:hypothetical protein